MLVAAGHDTTLVCRDAEQAEAIGAAPPQPALPVRRRAARGAGGDHPRATPSWKGRSWWRWRCPAARSWRRSGRLAGGCRRDAVLLSLTKGLDPATGRRLSEVLVELAAPTGWRCCRARTTPRRWCATCPTASVIASADMELARRLQCAISDVEAADLRLASTWSASSCAPPPRT